MFQRVIMIMILYGITIIILLVIFHLVIPCYTMLYHSIPKVQQPQLVFVMELFSSQCHWPAFLKKTRKKRIMVPSKISAEKKYGLFQKMMAFL